MFEGWMSHAGTEIGNSARTYAYARSLLPAMNLRDPHRSGDLPLVLGDEPYRTPALDPAPWVSDQRPESADFLGFYPTRVTGIEDSTRSTEITELTTDGGVPSRPRSSSKDFSVQGLLVALSQHGLDEGMRWMKGVLAGNDCSGADCAGDQFCYMAYLPEFCDYSDYAEVPLSESLGPGIGQWVLYGDGVVTGTSNGMRVRMPCGGDGAQRKISGLIPGEPYRLSLDMFSASEIELEVAGVSLVAGSFGVVHAASPLTPWIIDFIAPAGAITVRVTSTATDCSAREARIYGARLERTLVLETTSLPRFTAESTREPGSWTFDEPPIDITTSAVIDPDGSGAEILRLAWANATGAPINVPAGDGAARIIRGLTPGQDYTAYVQAASPESAVISISVDADNEVLVNLGSNWFSLNFTATNPQHLLSVELAEETEVPATDSVSIDVSYIRVDADPSGDLGDPDQSLPAIRTLHRVTSISGPKVDQNFQTPVGAMRMVSFIMSATHPFAYGELKSIPPPPSGTVSLVPNVECVNGEAIRTNYAFNPKLASGIIGDPPDIGVGTAGLIYDAGDVDPVLAGPNSIFSGNSLQIFPVSSDPDVTYVEIPESGVFLEGHTYTISADVGMEFAQIGDLSQYARRIVVADDAGVHASDQPPNITGSGRIWVTFTLTGTLQYIRLYCGAADQSGAPSVGESDNSVMMTNFLVEELGVPGTYFDGDSPNAEWTGADELSTSVWEKSGVSTIIDPDCPVIPDAPQPPVIDAECLEDAEVWRRYILEVPASEAPNWSRSEVVTTITTGASEVRSVRVRFYDNAFERAPEELDPCDYCGEFFVSYIPALTTLTIDGVLRRVTADVASTGEQVATNLVYGAEGGPILWPELTCDTPYIVTVDITPEEILDLDVRLAVALRE